ncbi:MAG: hypothetical protein QXD60_03230 [Nanopusillaceae archaeon]
MWKQTLFLLGLLFGLALPAYSKPSGIPRVLSGWNANIQLAEGKNLVYLVPVNYEAQDEKLGFIRPQDSPQETEHLQEFVLERVGTALVGQPGSDGKLYPSFFLAGLMPSKCHRLAVTYRLEEKTIHLLTFAAVDRTKICPRQAEPVAAAVVLPVALLPGIPTELTINYVPVAQVHQTEDGNLEVLAQGRQWRITRMKEILEQGTWDPKWVREWVQAKPIPKKP